MKCDKCDRTFKNKQALSMHQARTHGPKAKAWGKKKTVTGKAYGKRMSATEAKQEASSAVRFCPCCGTNIEAVRVAVRLTA